MMLDIPEGALKNRKHKAVFFDAGETLFQIYPSIGFHYARLAQNYGVAYDPETVEFHFREEWKSRPKSGHFTDCSTEVAERAWWYDLVKAIFDRCGGVPEFERFFDELYILFATEKVWRLFPEVNQVLKTCRERGVTIGIVSNWDSRLLKICESMKLTEQMNFVLASSVVGVSKPDPGIFRMALEHAGVEPEAAIHVGDSISDDMEGARAAGLDALWINRKKQKIECHFAQTDTLLDVLELC